MVPSWGRVTSARRASRFDGPVAPVSTPWSVPWPAGVHRPLRVCTLVPGSSQALGDRRRVMVAVNDRGNADRGATKLVGRRTECEALDQLVADVLAGTSRVIVLRGDAGVGKSALLDYLSDRVADWHVARAVGVESEMELAYSGLHQLCAPMLEHVDRLPAPAARRARDGVRQERRAGARPVPGRARHADAVRRGRRAAAAGLHRRRRAMARPGLGADPRLRRPPPARRADRDRVRRRGRESATTFSPGCPHSRSTDSATSDARALLLANVHGPLDCRRLRADRSRRATAIRSLCSSCHARGAPPLWPAVSGFPTVSRSPGKIEQSYAGRLLLLPSDTQLLVLTAAAEPLGDPVLLHRAAETLGIDIAAAGPAQDAGLLQVRGRVEFAHPLVRSAAYRSAAADDRHRVHRALADATDRRDRPGPARLAPRPRHPGAGRGGRGRARAVGRPRAGSRRGRRGGRVPATRRRADARPGAASAARAGRGAGEPPGRRVRRGARAPGHGGGRAARRARSVPASTWCAASSPSPRACGSDAPPLLLKAARRLEPIDPELARETYLRAWGAAFVAAGQAAGTGVLLDICHAVRALPARPGAPRPLDLLLDGLALLTTDGHAAATPMLQRAAAALADIPVEDALRWGWVAAAASNAVWDNRAVRMRSPRGRSSSSATPAHLRSCRSTCPRWG